MMPGPRKALHDIAPKIRAGTLRALARRGGGDAVAAIADEIEKAIEKGDFVAVLNAVSKFTVREKEVSGKVEHDHKHDHIHRSVQETSDWIAEAIARNEDSAPKKSVSH